MPFIAKSVVFLHWKINQSEIIQNFCENKDKPEMACNGKCHLSKEILKIDQPSSEEKSNPLQLTCFNFQFSPFIVSIEPFKLERVRVHQLEYTISYVFHYCAEFNPQIFHPPAQLFV